ncbi:MAG: amidase [Alphaproteobacteria bacterium]|nr:amidase [Alphaproteobacteria bacterium]
MSGAGELAGMTLAALAKALARGKVSAVEATTASLKGLESIGRQLNAVAGVDPEQAVRDARRADRERAQGRRRGPLHGVPLAHKDMYYRKGRLSECGSIIRKGYVPRVTATVLRRLDAAGALDIARLNMVEFALGPTGHNPHTGHVRNPWNTAHVTGGSSSGPAASVAARLVYGALGSDTGGSIRLPAACCGLVGIKPTYGLVSRFGAMPLSFSQDHVGPITRTIEDAALMLQAIAGPDPEDATTVARRVPNFRAELDKGVKGRTIAIADGWFRDGMSDEVAHLLDAAAAVYRRLGARVQRIAVPSLDRINDMGMLITGVEAASYHGAWMRERPQDYSNAVRARIQQGMLYPAVRYVEALRLRARMLDWFQAEVMGRAEVMLAPVLSTPVPTIASTDADGDPGTLGAVVQVARNTRPINYLGLPAVSVPCGWTRNGLPAGFQLVGRPFAETRLIRWARAYEREGGSTDRAPPISSSL